MNRSARRAAARSVPRADRPWDGWPPPLVTPVTDCICDGFPCPFCEQVTAPDDLGIWRCLCGWSGVLVLG